MNLRDETLTDEIATIIQAAHSDPAKTSHDVALEIMALLELKGVDWIVP